MATATATVTVHMKTKHFGFSESKISHVENMPFLNLLVGLDPYNPNRRCSF